MVEAPLKGPVPCRRCRQRAGGWCEPVGRAGESTPEAAPRVRQGPEGVRQAAVNGPKRASSPGGTGRVPARCRGARRTPWDSAGCGAASVAGPSGYRRVRRDPPGTGPTARDDVPRGCRSGPARSGGARSSGVAPRVRTRPGGDGFSCFPASWLPAGVNRRPAKTPLHAPPRPRCRAAVSTAQPPACGGLPPGGIAGRGPHR